MDRLLDTGESLLDASSLFRDFPTMFKIQSTPLIKDALVPVPLSFIEGVSFIEGFWSS